MTTTTRWVDTLLVANWWWSTARRAPALSEEGVGTQVETDDRRMYNQPAAAIISYWGRKPGLMGHGSLAGV